MVTDNNSSNSYYRKNDDNENKRQKTNEDDITEPASKNTFAVTIPHFDNGILCEVFTYLDVVSIIEAKVICKQWNRCCEQAIDFKGGTKAFVDNFELSNAVAKYCNGKREDIEGIAQKYGYPINKWDVSDVKDFSEVFADMKNFNEYIGDWKVDKATDMDCMFADACSFDQDLSKWKVSKVQSMEGMFYGAKSFNGDISKWDVSNVSDMKSMFCGAKAFARDISAWDVSRVTDKGSMFSWAKNFNRHPEWRPVFSGERDIVRCKWNGQGGRLTHQ